MVPVICPEFVPKPRPGGKVLKGAAPVPGSKVQLKGVTPPVVATCAVYFVLAIAAGTEVDVIARTGGGVTEIVNGCVTPTAGEVLSFTTTVKEKVAAGAPTAGAVGLPTTLPDAFKASPGGSAPD